MKKVLLLSLAFMGLADSSNAMFKSALKFAASQSGVPGLDTVVDVAADNIPDKLPSISKGSDSENISKVEPNEKEIELYIQNEQKKREENAAELELNVPKDSKGEVAKAVAGNAAKMAGGVALGAAASLIPGGDIAAEGIKAGLSFFSNRKNKSKSDASQNDNSQSNSQNSVKEKTSCGC